MSSIKIIAENKKEYNVEVNGASEGLLNGEGFNWDVAKIGENKFHVIKDHKSYNMIQVETVTNFIIIRRGPF